MVGSQPQTRVSGTISVSTSAQPSPCSKKLCSMYGKLINSCSSTAFWTPYQDSTLIPLLDAQGLQFPPPRIQAPSSSSSSARPAHRSGSSTVTVAPTMKKAVLTLAMCTGYRFFFYCETDEDRRELRGVYKRLLRLVDPMELAPRVRCRRVLCVLRKSTSLYTREV